MVLTLYSYERVAGIEPASMVWKTIIISINSEPLYDTRIKVITTCSFPAHHLAQLLFVFLLGVDPSSSPWEDDDLASVVDRNIFVDRLGDDPSTPECKSSVLANVLLAAQIFCRPSGIWTHVWSYLNIPT